jgi:hypothetical protein
MSISCIDTETIPLSSVELVTPITFLCSSPPNAVFMPDDSESTPTIYPDIFNYQVE